MQHSWIPGSSRGKRIHLPMKEMQAGDAGLIPRWERAPGGGNGNPLQDSCLENPHGQRSLEGYSPRGHKGKSRMTSIRWKSMLKT